MFLASLIGDSPSSKRQEENRVSLALKAALSPVSVWLDMVLMATIVKRRRKKESAFLLPLRKKKGKNGRVMKVCVFCGSSLGDDPSFSKAAKELGEFLAKRGDTLVYGGSRKGLMGVLSDAAFQAGGEVIAVEPRFFLDSGAVTDSITALIMTETMSERKQKMIDLADCFIALPGGIGTLDEISEAMTDIGLGQAKGGVILFSVNGFYDPVCDLLASFREHGFIKPDWTGAPYACSDLAGVESALNEIEGKRHA